MFLVEYDQKCVLDGLNRKEWRLVSTSCFQYAKLEKFIKNKSCAFHFQWLAKVFGGTLQHFDVDFLCE